MMDWQTVTRQQNELHLKNRAAAATFMQKCVCHRAICLNLKSKLQATSPLKMTSTEHLNLIAMPNDQTWFSCSKYNDIFVKVKAKCKGKEVDLFGENKNLKRIVKKFQSKIEISKKNSRCFLCLTPHTANIYVFHKNVCSILFALLTIEFKAESNKERKKSEKKHTAKTPRSLCIINE